jgi:hypothetical protein
MGRWNKTNIGISNIFPFAELDCRVDVYNIAISNTRKDTKSKDYGEELLAPTQA